MNIAVLRESGDPGMFGKDWMPASAGANGWGGRRTLTTSAIDRFKVVSPGQTYVGKQGFTYGAGASKETVGAQKSA